MRIAGGWRITEAELWDCDALNLVAPAFIEFTEDGSSGSFGFVAVQARWTVARWSGTGARVWSSPGKATMSAIRPAAAVGLGWGDGSLCGRIFFHLGDDSGFTAVRETRTHPPRGQRAGCLARGVQRRRLPERR